MHLDLVTLRGPSLRLVPFARDALAEVTAAQLSAPEVFRYFAKPMLTAADVEARLTLDEAMHAARTGIAFVARDRKTGEILGGSSVVCTDSVHRRVEIGWTWILPKFQGTRVNTEMKLLQLAHCFDSLACLRVEFKTDARNAKSRAALKRIGATEEGTHRSHMICADGYVRDSVYFSVIESEWPAVRARLREL